MGGRAPLPMTWGTFLCQLTFLPAGRRLPDDWAWWGGGGELYLQGWAGMRVCGKGEDMVACVQAHSLILLLLPMAVASMTGKTFGMASHAKEDSLMSQTASCPEEMPACLPLLCLIMLQTWEK